MLIATIGAAEILRALTDLHGVCITSVEGGGMPNVFSLVLVCLSVNKITQNVVDRFSRNLVDG